MRDGGNLIFTVIRSIFSKKNPRGSIKKIFVEKKVFSSETQRERVYKNFYFKRFDNYNKVKI